MATTQEPSEAQWSQQGRRPKHRSRPSGLNKSDDPSTDQRRNVLSLLMVLLGALLGCRLAFVVCVVVSLAWVFAFSFLASEEEEHRRKNLSLCQVSPFTAHLLAGCIGMCRRGGRGPLFFFDLWGYWFLLPQDVTQCQCSGSGGQRSASFGAAKKSSQLCAFLRSVFRTPSAASTTNSRRLLLRIEYSPARRTCSSGASETLLRARPKKRR